MIFSYNLGKNIKLKLERGVGFENAIEQIEKGNYQVAKIKSKNHFGQLCFIIKYSARVWIVPFREFKTKIHLYTMFRKD
jgi:hypothetical protein